MTLNSAEKPKPLTPDARSGILIRPIRPIEYDVVADLADTANTHDYALSDEYRESLRDVETRARDHEVWVAEDVSSGLLVGTVTTPRQGGFVSDLGQPGELDFRVLAVHPSARGRGVGEELTSHVITLAVQRGALRVVMNSSPEMVSAHRLYYRLGFELLPDRFVEVTHGSHTFTLLTFGLDLAVDNPDEPG